MLLPGIAPHLFQSRAPARLQPKMLVKDSPEGLVADHSRTPSDGSTVAPPTLEDVQAGVSQYRVFYFARPLNEHL
jgi:hypothetical protein